MIKFICTQQIENEIYFSKATSSLKFVSQFVKSEFEARSSGEKSCQSQVSDQLHHYPGDQPDHCQHHQQAHDHWDPVPVTTKCSIDVANNS